VEADIPTHVVSDDGPIMAPDVCRAAFQRTVGTIFYHTGFEDFQPSALEAVTDLAAEYFQKLTRTFLHYQEIPKVKTVNPPGAEVGELVVKKRYSLEEALLHTLNENSMDIESLEGFVKDDVDRLGQKLGVMHERMKGHLADLLVYHPPEHYFELKLTSTSDLPLILLLVLMELEHSKTTAISLLVETLPKISVKISSASKSLVLIESMAWPLSACLSISLRIACIMRTSLRSTGMLSFLFSHKIDI
jgi:hypothetical protein